MKKSKEIGIWLAVLATFIGAIFVAYKVDQYFSLDEQLKRAHEITTRKVKIEALATQNLRIAQDSEEGLLCKIGERDLDKDAFNENAAWKVSNFCEDPDPDLAMVWGDELLDSLDESSRDQPIN